jgi:thiol:disulfide interchange protein
MGLARQLCGDEYMQSETPIPPPVPVIMLKAFPPSIIGMMMLQVAVVLLGLCSAAIYVGRILDAQWNTRPWVSVGLLVLASVLALVIIYKLSLRTVEKTQLAYTKWQAETQQPVDTEILASSVSSTDTKDAKNAVDQEKSSHGMASEEFHSSIKNSN